ncbi:hypothetical protein VNO77_19383 [Canavalia gladiata]|uniref:Uncharacterized protein n=1 Tax=Canavalia gladiata TaxID=3824 RepID=A0AAN9LRF6_CANGL
MKWALPFLSLQWIRSHVDCGMIREGSICHRWKEKSAIACTNQGKVDLNANLLGGGVEDPDSRKSYPPTF